MNHLIISYDLSTNYYLQVRNYYLQELFQHCNNFYKPKAPIPRYKYQIVSYHFHSILSLTFFVLQVFLCSPNTYRPTYEISQLQISININNN